MKYTLLLITLLITTTCTKDKHHVICHGYTELKDTNHLVDMNQLKMVPEFLDTLNKYPQLQVYRFIDDEYVTIIHCHLFYKGLKIYTANYRLDKIKRDNSIIAWPDTAYVGTINSSLTPTINISLTPSIQYLEAIKIAQQATDFSDRCISYRLGIFDISNFGNDTIPNYKLIWKVQGDSEGDSGCPQVVLDANSGEVYWADDCIIID